MMPVHVPDRYLRNLHDPAMDGTVPSPEEARVLTRKDVAVADMDSFLAQYLVHCAWQQNSVCRADAVD